LEIDMEQTLSIHPDMHVGEIAAALAGATAVFRKHKIDFCCGGNVPISEALERKNLDASLVLGELRALAATPPEAPSETNALIEHIIRRYHDTHRAELPELVKLAKRVEAVHRDHADVPAGLADILETALDDLGEHMEKEEMILFPAMRQGMVGMVDGPIAVMRHEHDDHALTIRALQEITHGYQPPAGACRSWQALYQGVDKLVSDLTEHMHLENNVLFPRFESR
jgi:regulator of cell morphogenesis and NO signaling